MNIDATMCRHEVECLLSEAVDSANSRTQKEAGEPLPTLLVVLGGRLSLPLQISPLADLRDALAGAGEIEASDGLRAAGVEVGCALLALSVAALTVWVDSLPGCLVFGLNFGL